MYTYDKGRKLGNPLAQYCAPISTVSTINFLQFIYVPGLQHQLRRVINYCAIAFSLYNRYISDNKRRMQLCTYNTNCINLNMKTCRHIAKCM